MAGAENPAAYSVPSARMHPSLAGTGGPDGSSFVPNDMHQAFYPML